MELSVYRTIEGLIGRKKEGSVFSISDFEDYAHPKIVSKYLTRLSEKGYIQKIVNGIFWKPKKGDIPNMDSVAQAISRGNRWQSAPSGETALVVSGIKDVHFLEWTYVTDGTDRTYTVFGHVISFKHTTSKLLKGMSRRTATFIQVLKAYGKEYLTEENIAILKKHFDPDEIVRSVAEMKYAPDWIKRVVKRYISNS